MLKFTEFTEENIEKVSSELFDSDDYALEVLNSFDFSDEDVYYATACLHGCILIRIYDFGRYMFLYPIEMEGGADSDAAVLEIAEYARREEIGLCFADVPTECVKTFLDLGFLHLNIDAETEETCRIKIKTELEMAPDNIVTEYKNIMLTEILESDINEYADLCRDEELNKFWGYDYKSDNLNPTDYYFFESIKEGRMLGVSINLAVRENGKFVGEVQLFAPDGRGECEFAIRISRKYQERGFGSLATEATINLAESLGIRKLSCDVLNENEKSINLMKKYFAETESRNLDRRHFELQI